MAKKAKTTAQTEPKTSPLQGASWLTVAAWNNFGGWIMSSWDIGEENVPLATLAYHARHDIETNLRAAMDQAEKKKNGPAILTPELAFFVETAFDFVDWTKLAEMARHELELAASPERNPVETIPATS